MPASKNIRLAGLALLLALTLLAFAQVVARAQSDEQLELGARLFAENCAVCHGPNGEGRVGATLAKDWPSIRPDLTVRTIIENGVPGTVMPAWSQVNGGPLNDQEIDAIIAYILSWQTGGAPQITPGPTPTRRPEISPIPNVEGDPNRGGVLFDQNCALCHGLDGEGRIGATLAKDWPSVRPDLSVKNTIQNGIPNTVMPAWSQTNGGPLSETEINDLVAFILSWQKPAAPQPTATPAPTPSWLSGWGGVLVFLVLFFVIIAAAIIFQRRDNNP